MYKRKEYWADERLAMTSADANAFFFVIVWPVAAGGFLDAEHMKTS